MRYDRYDLKLVHSSTRDLEMRCSSLCRGFVIAHLCWRPGGLDICCLSPLNPSESIFLLLFCFLFQLSFSTSYYSFLLPVMSNNANKIQITRIATSTRVRSTLHVMDRWAPRSTRGVNIWNDRVVQGRSVVEYKSRYSNVQNARRFCAVILNGSNALMFDSWSPCQDMKIGS